MSFMSVAFSEWTCLGPKSQPGKGGLPGRSRSTPPTRTKPGSGEAKFCKDQALHHGPCMPIASM